MTDTAPARPGRLVLLSGGQDSATCLAWALAQGGPVETVGFAYGQRHAVELEARLRVREAVGALVGPGTLGPDHALDLSGLSAVGETAMTAEMAFATDADGLPNTFVPGRNLAFLVLAAALAHRRGLGALVGGMCQADGSGYPDCREDAVTAQAEAIRLGMATDLVVETPLMYRDKAATWHLAETLGGPDLVEAIRTLSHTCYRGERGTLRAYGYGCDDCPACGIRERGWAAYRAGRAS